MSQTVPTPAMSAAAPTPMEGISASSSPTPPIIQQTTPLAAFHSNGGNHPSLHTTAGGAGVVSGGGSVSFIQRMLFAFAFGGICMAFVYLLFRLRRVEEQMQSAKEELVVQTRDAVERTVVDVVGKIFDQLANDCSAFRDDRVSGGVGVRRNEQGSTNTNETSQRCCANRSHNSEEGDTMECVRNDSTPVAGGQFVCPVEPCNFGSVLGVSIVEVVPSPIVQQEVADDLPELPEVTPKDTDASKEDKKEEANTNDSEEENVSLDKNGDDVSKSKAGNAPAATEPKTSAPATKTRRRGASAGGGNNKTQKKQQASASSSTPNPKTDEKSEDK